MKSLPQHSDPFLLRAGKFIISADVGLGNDFSVALVAKRVDGDIHVVEHQTYDFRALPKAERIAKFEAEVDKLFVFYKTTTEDGHI